jgi:hypothetical protein
MKTKHIAACAMLVAAFSATQAVAAVVTVVNPSFETLPSGGLPFTCGTGCAYSVGAIPGWNNSGSSGQFQPDPPAIVTYFSTLSDGPTSAYTNGPTISQTVADTVQQGVIYTLLVDLGARNDLSFDGTADLLINGTRYVATGVAPTRGNWATFTATYTGLASDVGDSITIELNATGAEGNFDNVRLSNSLASPVPEPATLGLIGFSLVLLGAFARRKIAS